MSLFFNTTRIEALEEKVKELKSEIESKKKRIEELRTENFRLKTLSSKNVVTYKDANVGDIVSNKEGALRKLCNVDGNTLLFDIGNGEIININKMFLDYTKDKPKTLETVREYMRINEYI